MVTLHSPMRASATMCEARVSAAINSWMPLPESAMVYINACNKQQREEVVSAQGICGLGLLGRVFCSKMAPLADNAVLRTRYQAGESPETVRSDRYQPSFNA
jgi:hypothetical protein